MCPRRGNDPASGHPRAHQPPLGRGTSPPAWGGRLDAPGQRRRHLPSSAWTRRREVKQGKSGGSVGTTDQGKGKGRSVVRPMGTAAYGGKGQGKGKGRGEGRLGQGGRGRSKGGEKPMGTTAYGGKGSKGRAANGDQPIGAASCRRDHHTMASCQHPPPPLPTTPQTVVKPSGSLVGRLQGGGGRIIIGFSLSLSLSLSLWCACLLLLVGQSLQTWQVFHPHRALKHAGVRGNSLSLSTALRCGTSLMRIMVASERQWSFSFNIASLRLHLGGALACRARAGHLFFYHSPPVLVFAITSPNNLEYHLALSKNLAHPLHPVYDDGKGGGWKWWEWHFVSLISHIRLMQGALQGRFAV